jgi:hypothetical protein
MLANGIVFYFKVFVVHFIKVIKTKANQKAFHELLSADLSQNGP